MSLDELNKAITLVNDAVKLGMITFHEMDMDMPRVIHPSARFGVVDATQPQELLSNLKLWVERLEFEGANGVRREAIVNEMKCVIKLFTTAKR